jgi:DNA-binding MarR family transcriptional regulator
MKLEGGEWLVLKSLLELQGDSINYVEDVRLVASTKMAVGDVRDWLETLEEKGYVERTRLAEGFRAYVTAKGRQALRLMEPIPTLRPVAESAEVSIDIPVPTGAPSVAETISGETIDDRQAATGRPRATIVRNLYKGGFSSQEMILYIKAKDTHVVRIIKKETLISWKVYVLLDETEVGNKLSGYTGQSGSRVWSFTVEGAPCSVYVEALPFSINRKIDYKFSATVDGIHVDL